MKNYVGISGVANPGQHEAALDIVRGAGLNSADFNLLLGVKATEKTQWNDEPNKYGTDWYPVGEDICKAIGLVVDFDDPDLLPRIVRPAIQMYFGSLADDIETAKAFTKVVLDRGAGWVRYSHNGKQAVKNILQYDRFPWMDRWSDEYFSWLVHTGQASGVILQCHGSYMDEYHPYEIVKRLRVMQNLGLTSVRVLFDASHGTGKEMNPESLRPFVGGIVESDLFGEVGVVVAGGLNGSNLKRFIPPLIEEFGLLSWDAEGKLHHKDKVNNGAFIQSELASYLKASAEITRLYSSI